jgi:hypothetical protein
MKNLFGYLLGISTKHVILFALFGIIIYVTLYRPYGYGLLEGFSGKDGWNLASMTSLENAHGSAPAGVNALPGELQYQQNSASPPVNPANKNGNPENTNPELKKQPMFSY